MPSKYRAFTFIEVITALAIVAIALAVLIRLHIFSINLTDRAETTTQAVLLAEEKMTEMLAQPLPKLQTAGSSERRGNHHFHWQTEITDLVTPTLVPLPSDLINPAQAGTQSLRDLTDFNQADLAPLRRIRIMVNWYEGRHQKQVSLTSYIADRHIP
ncbi:MAG: hypothetical protein AMJ79_04975 [Phycisphaerae bacterium SM23_30]|nr:MAG: hypothetical protein AMJ79_04975 [Phycisphaerae bacterium SM23_30]